jgi:hypothetical protein
VAVDVVVIEVTSVRQILQGSPRVNYCEENVMVP